MIVRDHAEPGRENPRDDRDEGTAERTEELSIPVDRGVSGDLRSGVLTAV